MAELLQCSCCGEHFYKDTVISYLEYKGVDYSDYDGTLCFECAYRELTGEDYDEYDSNGVPDGCRECGGDYPNCKYSCPRFDD